MDFFDWLITIVTVIEVIFMAVVAWKWWIARQFDTEHMEMKHDFKYDPQADMTPQESVILARAFCLYGEYMSKEHLHQMNKWAGKSQQLNLKRHYKKI